MSEPTPEQLDVLWEQVAAPESAWQPPTTEPVPPQVVAAQEIQHPEAGFNVGRICGHLVQIAINRGEDFCCEQCKKDFGKFSPRRQRGIALRLKAGKSKEAHSLFQSGQLRLRVAESKEQQ